MALTWRDSHLRQVEAEGKLVQAGVQHGDTFVCHVIICKQKKTNKRQLKPQTVKTLLDTPFSNPNFSLQSSFQNWLETRFFKKANYFETLSPIQKINC